MKDNELKIIVPKGWELEVENNSDGSRVITVSLVAAENITYYKQSNIMKRLVRASELSLYDYFMSYVPKNPAEKTFKDEVEKVIKDGVKDFYRPIIDPSFCGADQIGYRIGQYPARSKAYNWWVKTAKNLGYRLGTRSEYIAFLAVLIKELVDSGKSIEWAWNAVCNNSNELGNYINPNSEKVTIETTGKRGVCGWYDLANTYKILAEDEDAGGFWLAGGCCGSYGYNHPLATFKLIKNGRNNKTHVSTGWLVVS